METVYNRLHTVYNPVLCVMSSDTGTKSKRRCLQVALKRTEAWFIYLLRDANGVSRGRTIRAGGVVQSRGTVGREGITGSGDGGAAPRCQADNEREGRKRNREELRGRGKLRSSRRLRGETSTSTEARTTSTGTTRTTSTRTTQVGEQPYAFDFDDIDLNGIEISGNNGEDNGSPSRQRRGQRPCYQWGSTDAADGEDAGDAPYAGSPDSTTRDEWDWAAADPLAPGQPRASWSAPINVVGCTHCSLNILRRRQ
ncbi:hypothetical protein L596_028964 [Steinernema carpocapsae]|uniref:Uncharacterized protein n=1 Tax=Steinernema carpocapsae TaxID=34508 RepID=A0A4V6XVL3_STECR|nr:hypothetical protein L596_028964 [Steinernema carpocapsae]